MHRARVTFKACAVPECGATIPSTRHLCRRHFADLPRRLRDLLATKYLAIRNTREWLEIAEEIQLCIRQANMPIGTMRKHWTEIHDE